MKNRPAFTCTIVPHVPTGSSNPVPVDAIDPAKIHASFTYDHPVYTVESMPARGRWADISLERTATHFAGAYWGNGFHEDGVQSGLRAARAIDHAPSPTAIGHAHGSRR